MARPHLSRGWVLGAVGAVGVAAAGTAITRLRVQRAQSSTISPGSTVSDASAPLGSLRGDVRTVVADDGVPLHAEVDDVAPDDVKPGHRASDEMDSVPVTVVFAHGYCLTLDSWHFQRAAYRGLVRSVFYDQRSHGRSGRSEPEHATIDQLGRDLKRVIDDLAPDTPVVLVGHSMGGMSVVSFAAQFPELIGEKVIGVALIATTAGGLDPARVLLPMLPARVTTRAARGAVAALQKGHRSVDQARNLGGWVAKMATQKLSFGGPVPDSYIEFLDDMLTATPFDVVADFFPNFSKFNHFDRLAALDQIPVSIMCGTADKLTSIGHSRKLHAHIPTSQLREWEHVGHMITWERHEQVNAELDQLIAASATRAANR